MNSSRRLRPSQSRARSLLGPTCRRLLAQAQQATLFRPPCASTEAMAEFKDYSKSRRPSPSAPATATSQDPVPPPTRRLIKNSPVASLDRGESQFSKDKTRWSVQLGRSETVGKPLVVRHLVGLRGALADSIPSRRLLQTIAKQRLSTMQPSSGSPSSTPLRPLSKLPPSPPHAGARTPLHPFQCPLQ